MTTIDLTPFYRSTIGFDHLGTLLNAAFTGEQSQNAYPPYNIEALGENEYAVSIAVAGFAEEDLELHVENAVLSVSGKRQDDSGDSSRKYLYKGIANRAFERKFNLADHVQVSGAELVNGLLVIQLRREVPEALKPRRIAINGKVSAGDKSKLTDNRQAA